MHIYFSGLGGTGIGPLALIAKQAGYKVSGSDKKNSDYIKYLRAKGIEAHIGQEDDSHISETHNKSPIDWFVYSSALPLERPDHPELQFIYKNNIKNSKRDVFLSKFLKDNKLKLIAAAGTHGKTTSTGMLIWILSQLGVPISYSIGAKTNFSDMGYFDPKSEYFIYECDEFDKNFLSFNPYISIFPSIDWDHHEIYKTRQEYIESFIQFINQSDLSILYKKDFDYLDSPDIKNNSQIVDDDDILLNKIKLKGLHNRRNALLCIKAVCQITNESTEKIIDIISKFPGTSRRFEKITNSVYTDYAHTPEEIEATLQRALEMSDNVVVVYEPLTNRRQHFMKEQYEKTFIGIKKLYWVPSYLAREDPKLTILTPDELINYMSNKEIAESSEKNDTLKNNIDKHLSDGDLVIFLAGGGGGSLDEWARKNFTDK